MLDFAFVVNQAEKKRTKVTRDQHAPFVQAEGSLKTKGGRIMA